MLEKIKIPEDVKSLNFKDLNDLCKELRQRIIDVISHTGGHLAPSLGVVELTVSLLKVFNPLVNRVVWDVGHQSYAYKILTERNDRFDTLRQFNGISGFNKISESKYDAFGVGHSSTSISAGLGICIGKELKNKPEKVVAVIGDGAMTAGEAFEGMNNTGGMQKDLIVILNDNEMSISRNVGGLHYYLANILSGKPYNIIKKEIWESVQSFPKILRKKIISSVRHIENLKSILIPVGFFEDIGFKYFGPIDGHNISALVKILKNVKNNVTGPCLVHVVTKKGKGFSQAEDDATKYHGVSPFDETTGEINSSKSKVKTGKKYCTIFGETLSKIAEKDHDIVAITAAMADGTGLQVFKKNHPDRFFDVGIAEQHAVTFGAGMATQGLKPFVAIYSTFLQRAYDQLIHDVALQSLPVRFCLDRGGIVGPDGPTHHGTFDLSYLNCIPNLTVMAPRDGNEFQKMIKYMAKYSKGPIAIRYPRGSIHSYPSLKSTRLGYSKSEIIFEGEKLALISAGTIFDIAFEAYNNVVSKKRNPYLVNARFTKPIDENLLKTLEKKKVKQIVTIEENAIIGGFGSAVSQKINELELDIKIKIFGIPDRFVPHGSIQKLKKHIGLTAKNISNFILNFYDKS